MSVVPVPAICLGLAFVFIVGYGATYLILDHLAQRKKRNPTVYRDTLEPVVPDYITEDDKSANAIIAGGTSVVLVIFLMLIIPREWAIVMWYALTAIGILVGILTFIIFWDDPHSVTENSYKPDTKTRQKPNSERKHKPQNKVYEVHRQQEKSENPQKKHQVEYRIRVDEIQKKQAEIKAVKDDLYSLFGVPDDKGQKRGKLLPEVLNRFFIANDINVKEPFEVVAQENEGTTEYIDGVIQFDEHQYLVGMFWQKEPLGKRDISLYLVRLFNCGYPNGILVTNSEFTQSAINTCKEALTQKTVILCELEEIVTLLEQDGSLKDFLKTKITAAVVDKNPLFKPL